MAVPSHAGYDMQDQKPEMPLHVVPLLFHGLIQGLLLLVVGAGLPCYLVFVPNMEVVFVLPNDFSVHGRAGKEVAKTWILGTPVLKERQERCKIYDDTYWFNDSDQSLGTD